MDEFVGRSVDSHGVNDDVVRHADAVLKYARCDDLECFWTTYRETYELTCKVVDNVGDGLTDGQGVRVRC